jgi:hypothetical protein
MLQWQYLNSKLKLIFYLTVCSLLSDGLSLLIISQGGKMNLPIGNLFLLIQVALLAAVLVDSRDRVLKIVIAVCVAFGVINYFFIQSPFTYNSYAHYSGSILLIILASRFLYLLMEERPVEYVQTLPLFWVSFGTLFYFGGNLFFFLFNNYIHENLPQIHKSIFNLHNLLNATKNIFLFIAVWVNYRNRVLLR